MLEKPICHTLVAGSHVISLLLYFLFGCSTYRILKIVGAVFGVISLIAAIAGYCCHKKKQTTDNYDYYTPAPVTTSKFNHLYY